MATRNFPQQGVVITPEPDPIFSGLSFNSDKSNTSGKLTIVDLPPTHGRGGTHVNPEPQINALELTWDDITNVPVADATSVSDWNTFFDLPTNGSVFTSVEVVGNVVKLYGGSGIMLRKGLFSETSQEQADRLIAINDKAGCVTDMDEMVFYYNIEEPEYETFCTQLTTVILNSCVTTGYEDFWGCISLVNVEMDSLEVLAENCFNSCESLEYIELPSLTTTTLAGFAGCTSLLSAILPNATSIGNELFSNAISLSTIYTPLLINCGGDVGVNDVFSSIENNIITITIPHAIESDGDIVALKAANTVTVVYSD